MWSDCKRSPVVQTLLGLALLACSARTCSAGTCSSGTQTPGTIADDAGAAVATTPLPEGSWRFIVSGDSRNCGDLIMPAIAAHSTQFAPAFYWHLGDLRAIYKIDEDMAAAAKLSGQVLKCENYQRVAWSDFVEHQIVPFGELPFYLGIGNHEVMTPKNEDAFRRQFYDWMNLPALRRQRSIDQEPSRPEPYFHWIQGGVDFIYLDNANGFFSEDQLTWLFRRLGDAKYNTQVKSLVVGMHEALPDSLSNDHSMGDGTEPRGRLTGEMVYNALLTFHVKQKKPVYILASHSHIYMENIFDTDKHKQNGVQPLPGWIAGTAGAIRYKLPPGAPPAPASLTDVYGYLLATVAADGTIDFEFKKLDQKDVPDSVKQRYPAEFVPWCFAHNSQNVDPPGPEITCEK
jgi:hypothetical protein